MSDDAPLWIDTDAEGRIVNWSRDALSLTGYSERAVVGHSLPLMLAKDRPDPATYRHILNGHSIEREASFRPPGRATIAGLRLDATAPLGALRFSLPVALSRRGPVAQFHQQFAEDSIVHRLDKVHIETRTLGATTIRVLAPAGQGH